MIRVAVAGAAGKMGATTCEAVEAAEDMELVARADPSLNTSLESALDGADVVVDFTTPDSAPENIRACLESGTHVVVGTSGFDLDAARTAAESAPGESNCFVAPNFALGAVLMIEAAKRVVEHMPECEIVELHRATKLDAPSGTALHTARELGEAGANVHEPIHSIRLPGLLAHQEIVFGGEGQTLTIRHDSIDRSSFMPGVLLAVRKVAALPERFTVGLDKLL
ncbi:MAG: 4-hydroxy-tetrahydrodipicolinate reductase [Solirubrobacterales bacterium]|jgi:4-hydroxy-tetrahydrodipicolinate reductase|nr:4-hydroxy-tetrahydrodipicolinate reductase [Solirubrobacterales bacterium]